MERIGIVGSGLMGRGIAQICASKGKTTMLYDIQKDVLEDALREIEGRYEREVQKGRMDRADKKKSLGNIHLTENLEELAEFADLIIEAAPEDAKIKKSIFQRISKNNDSSILASNTSSISIDELANGIPNPSRVVGMHWFNPPPIMKLVEIVVGNATSSEVVERIKNLAIELGKEPIIVKDFPGFATSRLGVALGLEAIRMVEQGVASPEDIDKAMELGYRHPMGPLKLTDYIGLDTRLKIAEYLDEEGISPAFKVPDLLRRMVKDGKLGKKSGEGFYTWKES